MPQYVIMFELLLSTVVLGDQTILSLVLMY